MANNFAQQITNDRNLQLLQDNIQKALSPLQSMPMVGGNTLTDVSVGTSQTAVPHGLGRVPQYWDILDINANATVWRSAASDARFLYLTASAGCTLTLWVN